MWNAVCLFGVGHTLGKLCSDRGAGTWNGVSIGVRFLFFTGVMQEVFMLKIVYRLRDLDFQKLMAVYAQSNGENAKEFYPDDSQDTQIEKVHISFEEYLREDFFRVNGAFYAIWEESGSYISALRMEPYADGLLLEALETAPSHRRAGYASKLILAVLAALPVGSNIYSHVHKRNAASLATHQRCGFREYLDYAKYVDGTVSRYACTMKISL